jgi:hypothetical protein
MKKGKKEATLSGTLTQVLLSPKGAIEGLLLNIRGKTVQLSTTPGAIDEYAHALVSGVRVVAKGTADHSPKTKSGCHPVFKLEQLTKLDGKVLRDSGHKGGLVILKGSVASIHYARHGEPNGVLLASGDFVHLRPHGMEKAGLKVGDKVVARGERRMTVLGTTLLEAREINHMAIA